MCVYVCVGEDQNSGDVMGGGPSNVENDDDHHDDNRDNQNPVCDNSKKAAPSRVAAVSKPSKPNKKRFVWSAHIKDCIKKELADCIGHDNIKYLTPARAKEFLEKHHLRDRTYLMLKNIIYNSNRPPRTKKCNKFINHNCHLDHIQCIYLYYEDT